MFFFCFGHIILQEYSIDPHKKCPIVLRPPDSQVLSDFPYLSMPSTFPSAAPLRHVCLFTLKVKDRKWHGRCTEDSSAPIRRQGELVSIKWYVLIPQITDTCSPLPSHPVASPLHHLMQCNHLHYLMKPYCTHPTPLPTQTHVYTVEPRCKLYNKYTKAWTSTTPSTERLLLPPHWKAPNATVRLL